MNKETDVLLSNREPAWLTSTQAAKEAALKAEERRKANAVVSWFGEKYNIPEEELSDIRGALGLAQPERSDWGEDLYDDDLLPGSTAG